MLLRTLRISVSTHPSFAERRHLSHDLKMTLRFSRIQWELVIVGPTETMYESGLFKAQLVFPPSFPSMPPEMTFISEMWHPNSTWRF